MKATPSNVQENTETRTMYRTIPQPGSSVIPGSANNMRLSALGHGVLAAQLSALQTQQQVNAVVNVY